MSFLLMLAAGAGSPLPNFTFREHRAGARYDMTALQGMKGCEADGSDVLCTKADSVNGRFAVVQFRIANERLSSFKIVADRAGLPDILAAFEEKYGEACAAGSEEVTNGYGMRLTSRTLTWCFQTGKLVLHERGSRLDMYSAEYVDEVNRPGPRRVKPDF